MSVYLISDLHGAYDAFTHLLKKIKLQCDGSDELYLLGDYGDWGSKSIECLQLVRQMDSRYEWVHPLMGNHERMMLDSVIAGLLPEMTDSVKPFRRSREVSDTILNWLYNNHGYTTWEGFLHLTGEEQIELLEWIRQLPLSAQKKVNGVSYMFAHAYPYYYDVEYPEPERRKRQSDAVWRRLILRENPFADYTGPEHYDMLVCGHTITQYYFQQVHYEKHWFTRKPRITAHNRIFHGEMFIDIDCGAKCLELEGNSQHVAALRERAQLAALRLDDMKEFYVHE